jgi:hypothetical protein
MGVPNVGILPDFPCPIAALPGRLSTSPCVVTVASYPATSAPSSKNRESYGHSMSFNDNASAMATATKHG